MNVWMYGCMDVFMSRAPSINKSTDSAGVRQAVDDAAEVGIEMIVQSFGTSFRMEDNSSLYMDLIREEIRYAHSKKIEVGGCE